MFCRKCGKKLDLHDKFCNICGEPVILEAVGETTIVPEPPKDLVWNVEGFPKEKKVGDVIFDWKTDSQGKDFGVDDFYVNEHKNVSAQKLLDQELEKINKTNIAREEAIHAAQAISAAETVSAARRIFSEEIKSDLEEIAKKTDKYQETKDLEVQSEAEAESSYQPRPESNLEPQHEANPEPKTDINADAIIATATTAAATADTDETAEAMYATDDASDDIATPETPATANDIETLNVPNKTELKYNDIFVEEEEEPKRKGAFFARFLLVLLILLIILEGVFLGFKYYMPENPYFKIVDNKVTQAVLTVESWFLVKTPAAEIPKEEEPVVEEPVAEEPTAEEPVNPFPENKNIKEISMNPNIVYVSGKDYGTADINKSLPDIESTDQVISTIVEYDSKWIDYVNSGDKSVLALTAPGSQAEKNALTFTKAGKIKETFNSLEIGEVRKGTKGYYIWVREEIEILENNLNTTKVYNWIYQLTPVENQMKIVNYYSYK